MSTRTYYGGPRHQHTEPCTSTVPTAQIPIYQAVEGAAVCDDEQVVTYLGRYVRLEKVDDDWPYVWESSEEQKMKAEIR